MNWGSWALWGFAATLVLTTLMAGSHGLGLTRMNIPYLLGATVTPDRDRAKVVGFGIHLLNGFIFALAYVAAFQAWGKAGILRGMAVGLVHAAFVLVAVMPVLPAFHPRMASAHHGPTEIRQLEPPGMLALHYGPNTPISVVLAHLVYGAILGAFYQPR